MTDNLKWDHGLPEQRRSGRPPITSTCKSGPHRINYAPFTVGCREGERPALAHFLMAPPVRPSDPHCPLRKDAFMARLLLCAFSASSRCFLSCLPWLLVPKLILSLRTNFAEFSLFKRPCAKAVSICSTASIRPPSARWNVKWNGPAATRIIWRRWRPHTEGAIHDLQPTNPGLRIPMQGVSPSSILGTVLEQPKNKPPTLASLASSPPAQPKELAKEPAKSPTVRGSLDFSKAPGVSEGVDPFSNANFATPPDAHSILAKADKEFVEKHYQAASKLYQQANASIRRRRPQPRRKSAGATAKWSASLRP